MSPKCHRRRETMRAHTYSACAALLACTKVQNMPPGATYRSCKEVAVAVSDLSNGPLLVISSAVSPLSRLTCACKCTIVGETESLLGVAELPGPWLPCKGDGLPTGPSFGRTVFGIADYSPAACFAVRVYVITSFNHQLLSPGTKATPSIRTCYARHATKHATGHRSCSRTNDGASGPRQCSRYVASAVVASATRFPNPCHKTQEIRICDDS